MVFNMLAYFTDILNDVVTMVNLISHETINLYNNTLFSYNSFVYLTLQFGLLVFVLSVVSLALPNYFGLYGAFILTSIPLYLS